MASFNQKSVDRLLHPIEGEKIAVRDLMTDEGERTLVDFGEFDYITKKALEGIAPTPPDIVFVNIPVNDPDVYSLDAGELAIINSLLRYPNFVAVCNGVQFNDIVPAYTGSVGSFTDCSVILHGDGSGNNIDDTDIQFS